MTSSPFLLSAREIAAQIRRKAVSPVDVARAHLDRIERPNPKLNAFVDCNPEAVLAQAREAEKAIQRGDELGPLHGVPVSIKSSIDVAGHHCEAGTRLRAGHIAAGLSAGGVGSDGGGSIREPAHFCGICGLKPTPGRIPSTGHFPKSGGPFAMIGVVGPMGRTVEDVRTLFEAMAGWDDGDPCAAPVELREIHETAVRTVPIGFFEDDGRIPVTKETRSAVGRAASLLLSCGFRVESFRPEGLEEARQLWWEFFGTAGGMILDPMLRGHESELSPMLREFHAWTKATPARLIASQPGESLLAAWLGRDAVREKILLQMRKYPVLICPTAAIPAFRHGEREWQVEGKTVKYL